MKLRINVLVFSLAFWAILFSSWSSGVVAADWGGAIPIENSTTDAQNPQVAISPHGDAIAVWEQTDGTRYNIYANRYVPGTGWGTGVLIETGSGDAHNPQVAMDSTGNAWAVWEQTDGLRFNIYGNRYDERSGAWTGRILLEIDNSGAALTPQIAMAPDGDAIVVWSQSDILHYNIYSNRYIAKAGIWSGRSVLETDISGNAVAPQIAISPRGQAIVVWRFISDSPTGNHTVWANRFVPGVGWGTAAYIGTQNDAITNPQVAIDRSGDAIVVLKQYSRIYARRFTTSDGWGALTQLQTSIDPSFNPKIAMTLGGDAMAVWEESIQFVPSHPFNRILQARRFDVHSGWGGIMTIKAVLPDQNFNPDVAVDHAGNAIVVYNSNDLTGNIDASLYDTHADDWTSVILDSGSSLQTADVAQIASDVHGDAIVVWEQENFVSLNYDIWANTFT